MHGKTILIVEDDQDLVRELLVSWKPQWTVRHVSSGKEAVEAIEQQRPDLILLDLSLPHHLADVDSEEGFGLLAFVRKNLQLSTPVIIITRDSSSATRRRAVALGANDLIGKPISVEDLDEAVNRLASPSCGSG